MIEPDWSVTPGWSELVRRATRMPVAERGRHGVWDVALRYSGPWREVPEGGPALLALLYLWLVAPRLLTERASPLAEAVARSTGTSAC